MAEEKSAREKNANAIAQQRHNQETAKQRQVNARLTRFAGLTKKNEEYMYKLDKALDQRGYDAAKKEEVIKQMVAELKEKQKQGITANKLYGTVTEKTELIIKGPKKKDTGSQQSFWVAALDNGSAMFTLFCLMYGVLGVFSKKTTEQATGGWLTLVVISVVTGVTMALFYEMLGRGRMRGWGRIARAIITLVVVWFVMFGILSLVPRSVNPPLPGMIYFILAIIGYGFRWVMKKKFNFRNNII